MPSYDKKIRDYIKSTVNEVYPNRIDMSGDDCIKLMKPMLNKVDSQAKLKMVISFIQENLQFLEMIIDDRMRADIDKAMSQMGNHEKSIVSLALAKNAIFSKHDDEWYLCEDGDSFEESGVLGVYPSLLDAAKEFCTFHNSFGLPEPPEVTMENIEDAPRRSFG